MVLDKRIFLGGAGQRSESGNILLTVTLVGLLGMALTGGLISNYAVSEARAVAESLAKIRVYWAMVGHIDYALSRMRRENETSAGWISDLDENGIQGVLLGHLDELEKGSSVGAAKCRGSTVTSTTDSRCSSWSYNEVSSDYIFHFKWSVFDPANNDPAEGTATDGKVGIRIDYVLEGASDNAAGDPTSSVASLNGLSRRIRDLEYIVCFVEPNSPLVGFEIGNCGDFETSLADASGAAQIVSARRCIYDDGGSPGTLTGSAGSKADNTATDTCI